MSTETDIFTKLSAISGLTSVRYLVQDAGDDEQPYVLPFAVYAMGPKEFEELQTFCGTNPDFFLQSFDVQIYAESTTECQGLASQCITALSGTGVLSNIVTAFEPDLRCYTTTVTFT